MFRATLTIFILCLALAVLAAFPAPGRASELQPLPDLTQGFDLKAYAATTDTVRKDFPELPDVAFEIALPKTWPERIALGQNYGEIARFDGPAFGDVRPYFSFKRLRVARENSAKLELMSYMLRQGYVLRSLKEIDDRNVEALYVVIDTDGDSYVVRTVARIMGPSLLLAEYALPVDVWDRLRNEQTFAMKSFKFLKDSDEPIEQRIERTYFKALRFYYPASWAFESEEARVDNRVTDSLATKGEGGLEAGRIHLALVSPRSLKDDTDLRAYSVDVPSILKDMRKFYETQGYDLGEAVESRKPDLNMRTDFAALDIYNLRRKVTQYDTDKQEPVTHELWVAVFQTAGPLPKTYIVDMLSPARGQDLYQWSANSRAFSIILKSIQ